MCSWQLSGSTPHRSMPARKAWVRFRPETVQRGPADVQAVEAIGAQRVVRRGVGRGGFIKELLEVGGRHFTLSPVLHHVPPACSSSPLAAMQEGCGGTGTSHVPPPNLLAAGGYVHGCGGVPGSAGTAETDFRRFTGQRRMVINGQQQKQVFPRFISMLMMFFIRRQAEPVGRPLFMGSLRREAPCALLQSECFPCPTLCSPAPYGVPAPAALRGGMPFSPTATAALWPTAPVPAWETRRHGCQSIESEAMPCMTP